MSLLGSQGARVDRRRRDQSLRRRIAGGITGVTGVAVLLFALPLAVAVAGLDRSQEYGELQSEATRVASLVPDNPISPTGPVNVPLPSRQAADAHTLIGIYTPRGRRVGGLGPERSSLAGAAADGQVHRGGEAGQLTAAVPVPSDRNVIAVVRAAVPTGQITARTARSWAAMGLLALAVLAVAWLLARRQGRRIAYPLERLTAAARELGGGNFAVQVEPSGIREADLAGSALRDTAARLGNLLERERAFSADASHQLRTPLTGLLLGLESALTRPAADRTAALQDALHRGRQLQETVDDLLSLRRDVRGEIGTLDLDLAVLAAEESWRTRLDARGRQLSIEVPVGVPAATASPAALRQIIDVLLGNALEHGAGTVTLAVADRGAAVAVEVSDEGPGIRGEPEAVFARRSPNALGHGIGLALARSLAEADGGRLTIRRAAPHPVFSLLLPVAETVTAPTTDPRGRSQPSDS